MTSGSPAELTALLDHSVLLQAIREQLSLGGVQLTIFPPADAKLPATSSVGTALSPRLRAAGVEVIVPEAALVRALADAEQEASGATTAIGRFATQVRQGAGSAVQDLGPSSDEKGELEFALQLVRPEFLVTTDGAHLRYYEGDPQALTPNRWLRVAIAALRANS